MMAHPSIVVLECGSSSNNESSADASEKTTTEQQKHREQHRPPLPRASVFTKRKATEYTYAFRVPGEQQFQQGDPRPPQWANATVKGRYVLIRLCI